MRRSSLSPSGSARGRSLTRSRGTDDDTEQENAPVMLADSSGNEAEGLDFDLSLQPENEVNARPGLSDIEVEQDFDLGDDSSIHMEASNQDQTEEPGSKRTSRRSSRNDQDQRRISKSMDPKKLDHAVMLAIEAAKTHEMVRRLFYFAVFLMLIACVFLVRNRLQSPFPSNVDADEGYILVYYENKFEQASSVIEGAFLILTALLLAFRNDFPINLGVLMLILFFTGFLFGSVVQESIYSELGDDFTCETE